VRRRFLFAKADLLLEAELRLTGFRETERFLGAELRFTERRRLLAAPPTVDDPPRVIDLLRDLRFGDLLEVLGFLDPALVFLLRVAGFLRPELEEVLGRCVAPPVITIL